MTYMVTITSQGQLSIPAKIRKQLGFSKNNKALMYVQDGIVIVEPVKDFLELGGSFKTDKKPLSNQELNDLMAEDIVNKYPKK